MSPKSRAVVLLSIAREAAPERMCASMREDLANGTKYGTNFPAQGISLSLKPVPLSQAIPSGPARDKRGKWSRFVTTCGSLNSPRRLSLG